LSVSTMTTTDATCVMKTEIAHGCVRFPAVFIRYGVMLCLLLALLMMAGCAATSNAVTDEEIVTNQKPMSTYTSLLLRDFELKRELYSDADGRMGEREQRYIRIPEQLTEQVLRYVTARRIFRNVSRNEKLSPTTLVLQGKFVRMGRFRISLEAVLLDGGTGKEVAYVRQTLWDVLDTTETVGRLGRELADFIDRIQYK
jgi:hypothetical protein